MIALWMLAATVAAALIGGAALAAERVARLWRLPARNVWSIAIVAALVLPAAVVAPRAMPRSGARAAQGAAIRLAVIVVRASDAARSRAGALARLDRSLAVLWGLSSVAMLLMVGGGVWRLRRARTAWVARDVDGTPVLVAHDVGPAVVGLRRPAIVLPEWALALDRPLRALILRHEAEHLRARDPLHLALGAVAVTLAPWNPALWWLTRRLRAALEIDCDARVIAAHRDVARYGLLLLAVAQRRAAPSYRLAGAPALAESTSDLSRRITAMRNPLPPRRLVRSAVGVAAIALTIAGALAACAVARDITGPPAPPPPPTPRQVHALREPDGAQDASIAAVVADSVDDVQAHGSAASEVENALVAPPPPPRAPVDRREPPPAPVEAAKPYFEFQVEKAVVPAPGNRGPRYPDELRAAGIEGAVLAQFVIDADGLPVMDTFKVLKSDHELFTSAVRTALAEMRFVPAEVGGHKVRQLIQTPFQFQLAK